MNLTEQELRELSEIKERWQNYKRKFCAGCLSEMIHIGDNNLPDCYEGRSSDNSADHAQSEDGETLSLSAQDIWALIRIIDARASPK